MADVIVKDRDGSPIVYENITVVELDKDSETPAREAFTSDTEIANELITTLSTPV